MDAKKSKMRIRATLSLKNDVAISAREKLGLTQYEAADLAGVPRSTITKIECMNLSAVSIKNLTLVAAYYGVDPEALAPAELRGLSYERKTIIREVPIPSLVALGESDMRRLALSSEDSVAENMDRETVNRLLAEAMEKLTDIEKGAIILTDGFGGSDPITFEEAAKRLGVNAAKVKRDKFNGIKKLQKSSRLRKAVLGTA